MEFKRQITSTIIINQKHEKDIVFINFYYFYQYLLGR